MKQTKSSSGSYATMLQMYEKDYTTVCLIVPTYNEVKNIQTLIKAVFSDYMQARYSDEKINLHMLVVDDSSPDGTGDAVRIVQRINPKVHLLERKVKNGLGAAYIAGMKYALDVLEPSFDVVFEMDADMSHDPSYLIAMINKVRSGADFVIGARYLPGGSIPDNWGMQRKLISRGANLYAKIVLRIPDVSDYTSGYRAIRTDALKQIDFSKLRTKGYAFQISLLEAMRRNGAVMAEVPIHFIDRTDGESKMQLNDIMEEGMFVLRAGFENIFSANKSRASDWRSSLGGSEKDSRRQKEHIVQTNSSRFERGSYELEHDNIGFNARGREKANA